MEKMHLLLTSILSATPVDGVDDDVSAAVSGVAANNGQFGALALATKINTNTGEHGVTADAFNIVRATTTAYIAESFAINGVTVRSRATKEEWVAAVSEEVHHVDATIDKDGFIVYSNTNGATINFASNNQGITADNYGGFVRLTSIDGSPISIEAGSLENGYVADTGNLADVLNIGFNEIVHNKQGGVTMRSVAAVDGTVLQASDGLKINDVLIGKLDTQTTDNIHASDKADAINALTSEHGVTARGFNKLKTTFDLAGATLSDHGDFTVNGITITMASVTTATSLVTTLNDGLRGQTDITASADESGNIIFESKSGLTITIDDSTDATGAGDLLKQLLIWMVQLQQQQYSSGNVTARGFIELTAASGGSIKIEDGQQDTLSNNGTTRIGFASSNEEGKTNSSRCKC